VQVNAFLVWFVWIITTSKSLGYWQFYLNSPKGYSQKIINAQTALNKQCTSLAYQVFSILASTFPCCSHGNLMVSGFGSSNGQIALNILHWCRNRQGVPLFCQSLASKSHLIHFKSFMATVYYMCACNYKIWQQEMQSVTFIFLLYITSTALVTQKIMQRNTMYYQRFVNWIKGSVIIHFSTEHNWTSIYR